MKIRFKVKTVVQTRMPVFLIMLLLNLPAAFAEQGKAGQKLTVPEEIQGAYHYDMDYLSAIADKIQAKDPSKTDSLVAALKRMPEANKLNGFKMNIAEDGKTTVISDDGKISCASTNIQVLERTKQGGMKIKVDFSCTVRLSDPFRGEVSLHTITIDLSPEQLQQLKMGKFTDLSMKVAKYRGVNGSARNMELKMQGLHKVAAAEDPDLPETKDDATAK